MKRAGIFFPIVFFGLIFFFAYYINVKFSKMPSRYTQDAVKSIPKYPGAISWEVSNAKKLCIYYFNGCRQAPSTITFVSRDTWTAIYWFYRQSLTSFGWTSNSNIVTSIPSSIVLTSQNLFKDTTCDAVIGEHNFKFSSNENKDNKFYEIQVTCY